MFQLLLLTRPQSTVSYDAQCRCQKVDPWFLVCFFNKLNQVII